MNLQKITLTNETFDSLPKEEQERLFKVAKNADVIMDPRTFQPYMVIEGVRYDIEAVEE